MLVNVAEMGIAKSPTFTEINFIVRLIPVVNCKHSENKPPN